MSAQQTSAPASAVPWGSVIQKMLVTGTIATALACFWVFLAAQPVQ